MKNFLKLSVFAIYISSSAFLCAETLYYDNAKYVGEGVNGKRHGLGVTEFTNGQKYVGEFLNDKRHGRGTFTWPDGSKYVGEWLDGKRHGSGVYLSADGKEFQGGYWENDKYVGRALDDSSRRFAAPEDGGPRADDDRENLSYHGHQIAGSYPAVKDERRTASEDLNVALLLALLFALGGFAYARNFGKGKSTFSSPYKSSEDTSGTKRRAQSAPMEPIQRDLAEAVVAQHVSELRRIRDATGGFSGAKARKRIRESLEALFYDINRARALEPKAQETELLISLNYWTAKRQDALARGARGYSDADWAAAAACESWLQSIIGSDGSELAEVEDLVRQLLRR